MDNPGRDAAGKLGAHAFSSEAPGQRSIADVLKDVVGNIQDLIRSEFRLAKVEMKEEGRKAMVASALFAAAGLLIFYAFGFLFLTAVYALSIALPAWLSALIVAVILGICGMIALSTGRGRWKQVHAPRQTAQTLKEDVTWTKEQAKL